MYISLSQRLLTQRPGKDFDWRTLNESFCIEDVTVPQLLQHVSKGGCFAPVFDGRRKQDSFVMAQHIGMDFDDGQPLDKLLSHPFIRSYASLIYPTFRHTPTHPRHRVVIVLEEPIYGSNAYKFALEVVHDLFPSADRACVDVSRMFFGNPRIDGEGLAAWSQPVEMPLSDLRMYAKKVLNARRQAERHAPAVNHRRYQPARQRDGLTIDETFDRLQAVDPYAMGYEEWVKLGSAIAHTFGEMAFGRFKSWSDRPGKQPLTLSKWQSFCNSHPNPAGAGTIITTLLQYERAA